MADRILVWEHKGAVLGTETSTGLVHYLEMDYAPLKVRIHAEIAPSLDDAMFDIRDQDGTSIFANQTPTPVASSGRADQTTSTTGALLPKGDSIEVDAEDFKDGLVLEEGTWLKCVPIKGGKGKNFTVVLELERLDDE